VSSGNEFKINRKAFEDPMSRMMQQAWTESKRWPNHQSLDVTTTWELNENGESVTPMFQCSPRR
jgi:hypothetical protein